MKAFVIAILIFEAIRMFARVAFLSTDKAPLPLTRSTLAWAAIGSACWCGWALWLLAKGA